MIGPFSAGINKRVGTGCRVEVLPATRRPISMGLSLMGISNGKIFSTLFPLSPDKLTQLSLPSTSDNIMDFETYHH